MENLAFSKGFEIEGYDVEIRTLSQGVEDIHTTFSISVNKDDEIDSVGHHIRPLIHWSRELPSTMDIVLRTMVIL